MASMTQPKAPHTPVQICFRRMPSIDPTGLKGLLVDEESLNAPRVLGILPYTPLPAGMKAGGMVACVGAGGERFACDYTTLIKDTLPCNEEHYTALITEMREQAGWDVQAIMATSINHTLRTIERVAGDTSAEELAQVPDSSSPITDDSTIEVEDFVIDFEIVNDDVDSKTGYGSDAFKEEWA